MGGFFPPVLMNGPVRSCTVRSTDRFTAKTNGTVKQTEQFRAKNERSGRKRTVIERLHRKEAVIERLDQSLNEYIMKRTIIERLHHKRTVIDRSKVPVDDRSFK